MNTGLIMGGGIAGLSFAIAARRAGLAVELCEAASELREQGAGLLLSPNAMRALATLGLDEEIRAGGIVVEHGRLTDARLSPLSHDAFAYYAARLGHPFVGIHRARLLAILARHAPECRTGTRYAAIESGPAGPTLEMADGSRLGGRWAVLADGIHSIGRRQLFPDAAVRDVGEWCWRGIAAGVDAGELLAGFREAWGGAWRFGGLPVGQGEVYWYALRRDSARDGFDTLAGPEAQRALLQEAAREFHPVFAELIGATPAVAILQNRLLDLPPMRRWHRGAVVCIGDAAHATTPNLGQGAGQAIEDAVALAQCLAGSEQPEEAFRRFTRLRKPRADRVIRESYRLGRFAGWSGPLAACRDALLRRLPPSFAVRQMRWLYQPDADGV